MCIGHTAWMAPVVILFLIGRTQWYMLPTINLYSWAIWEITHITGKTNRNMPKTQHICSLYLFSICSLSLAFFFVTKVKLSQGPLADLYLLQKAVFGESKAVAAVHWWFPWVPCLPGSYYCWLSLFTKKQPAAVCIMMTSLYLEIFRATVILI